jgi:hypothetical protein
MSNEGKLGPNAVWIFALATLGVAIGATYIVPAITHSLSQKTFAAVYFAVFGAGATLAVWLTRASVLRTIGAMSVAGAGLGVFYYIVISRLLAAAATEVGGEAAGHAGAAIGGLMGMVFAVAFLLDALAGSIAGALFGSKLRKGLPSPSLAKR